MVHHGNTRELQVPARYYLRLANVLPGGPALLQALLAEHDVALGDIQAPDAVLPQATVDAVVNQAALRSGRMDLGFELGKLLRATAHSFVGFGMLNSASFGEALRFEAQYFSLIMPSFRMQFRPGDGVTELRLTPRVAMSPVCLHFHLEAIATAGIREFDDLSGAHRPPVQLFLSMEAPPHAQRYEALRDVRTTFADATLHTPGVRFRLMGDVMTIPLQMADAHARAQAEARCSALVQRAARRREFSDWVSMALQEVSGALPTLRELAHALNLSPRTLNRHLQREGTSYRALAGGAQHSLACERLAAPGATVTEVAYSLGFSDSSNFARAFRARAACSPTAYQASLQANGPTTERAGQHDSR